MPPEVTPTEAASPSVPMPAKVPRPKPGERRVKVLQTLAAMLEQPKSEKITTAALAARLEVSEAALYRHFASKAQMFEGLIEFIEQSIFSLINQISTQREAGAEQAHAIVLMLLGFAEKNPGMTRVLTGEALVGEHERLQERMNQFLDRIEASLRQCLRNALALNELPPTDDIHARVRLPSEKAAIALLLPQHGGQSFEEGRVAPFQEVPGDGIVAECGLRLRHDVG